MESFEVFKAAYLADDVPVIELTDDPGTWRNVVVRFGERTVVLWLTAPQDHLGIDVRAFVDGQAARASVFGMDVGRRVEGFDRADTQGTSFGLPATWSVSVLVGEQATNEEAAEVVKARVIGRLRDTYDLVYIDYRDELTDAQIGVLLRGENPYESSEFSHFEEACDDERYERANKAIEEACKDDEYTILQAAADVLDEVRYEVYDRDTSDPLAAMLKNTPHTLFRYDLGYDLAADSWRWDDEQTETAARELATAAHLEYTAEVREAMRELVGNATYGGRLYVFWYGSVADALDLARVEGTPHYRKPGTVTFSGAHLLVLDHFNGSGHDVRCPVDIALDIEPGRVEIDAKNTGFGMSWDDICGLVKSAYRAHLTVTWREWTMDDLEALGTRWAAAGSPSHPFDALPGATSHHCAVCGATAAGVQHVTEVQS